MFEDFLVSVTLKVKKLNATFSSVPQFAYSFKKKRSISVNSLILLDWHTNTNIFNISNINTKSNLHVQNGYVQDRMTVSDEMNTTDYNSFLNNRNVTRLQCSDIHVQVLGYF